MTAPQPPAPADFGPTGSRPASLWPEGPDGGAGSAFRSTSFALSRFDPAAEEKAREQALTAAAFDVCHPALALRAVLLVQLVLAVGALVTAGHAIDWWDRQAVAAFAGAAATLLWLVPLCALRRPLRALPAPWRGLAVVALGAGAALLAWWPLAWMGVTASPGPLRLAGVAACGAGLAALLWTWLELRARIWQPAYASARLAELQSRIRPHFLFNALNTALALVQVDPMKAEAVLEDLAQLFRVALADAGASVSLAEEVDLARRYLAIEQVRFGERLQVHWDIEPRVEAARLPPLVLQPLVENAVRHGIEPSAQGGLVAIEGRVRRGQVELTVHNPVGDGPSRPGHGMALHNVRERLRLLHDVAGQCDTWVEAGRFHARLVVPL